MVSTEFGTRGIRRVRAGCMLLAGAVPALAYSTDGQRFVYDTNYCYYASSIPSTWQSSSALANARSAWNSAGSPFRLYYQSSAANYMYASNLGDNGIPASSWHVSHPNPNQPKLHTDCRIRFNTYYSWSTSGESTKYDVQAVATHELGHWLLLFDLYGSGDTEKTMYGYISKGETKKRSLHSDDIAGINYLY